MAATVPRFEDKFISSSAAADSKGKANANVKSMIMTRGGTRTSVTKTVNKLQQFGSSTTNEELEIISDKCKTYKINLQKLDDAIGQIMIEQEEWSIDEYNKQLDICEHYQDQLCRAIKFIEHAIKDSVTESNIMTSSPLQNSSLTTAPKIKLPIIELPTFNGKPEEYERFITSFETILFKHSLSSYEKLILLKGQLSGAAKVLVESLPLAELRFEAAKSLLDEAFCDKLGQQFAVIKDLLELQMSNYSDPLIWVSKARVLAEQVKNLSINDETFTQYFLWNSLNETFRSQYTAIVNKSKPSLEEILKNFFEANNRYKTVKDFKAKDPSKSKSYSMKQTEKVTSFATNVYPQKKILKKICYLCKEDQKDFDHWISECTNYSTPALRIKKLKDLKGCIHCGDLRHISIHCRTIFQRPCKICKQWHRDYLCVYRKENLADRQKQAIKENTTNHMVATEVKAADFGKNVVLPTTTMKCKKNHLTARALIDTGSQSSFILDSLAEEWDCKVLEERIELILNGFNGPKDYITKKVEVEVFMNKEPIKFEALCIPTINTNIKLKGLAEVLSSFRNKGYEMADKFLQGNNLNNIAIILGMDAFHLIQSQTVVFGKKEKSAYWKTPFGVLITGSICSMLKNLEDLPSLNSTQCVNKKKMKSLKKKGSMQSS